MPAGRDAARNMIRALRAGRRPERWASYGTRVRQLLDAANPFRDRLASSGIVGQCRGELKILVSVVRFRP
jgi:hypothetical protein